MRHKTLKVVAGAFLAATLGTACGSAKDNPCVVWTADNLANVAKLTLQQGSDTGCAPGEAATHYEELYLQIYPATNTLAIFPGNLLDPSSIDANGNRVNDDPAHNPIASGNWDNNGLVNGNTECTVPSLSTAEQDFTAVGGPDVKYEFSALTFFQAAFAQGTDWTATVKETVGSCVATYSAQVIAPEVTCTQDSDCAPLPDLAAGKALGSGIAPQYHTFCDLGPEGTAFTGDPSTGICFFADAYPSLCANDELEGGEGSSCQLGQGSGAATQAP